MNQDKMHLINKLFDNKTIRTVWDKEEEKYFISVVDVVGAISESKDKQSYWRKLKQRLKEEGSVTVKFLKTQNTCIATTDVIKHGEGTFVILSFRSYVSTFATDRFLDVEIMMNEKTGLKIPNTAIVEKEFYLVPEEYATLATENADTAQFGVQKYNDKGQIVVQYLDLELYEKKDGYYYINAPEVTLGDTIVKDDSNETFTVSKKGTLIGVYNINKGYADFRQITIQYQNEEYSIVTPNSNYGLRAYDYIVLDASTVEDDDLVYQKMAK